MDKEELLKVVDDYRENDQIEQPLFSKSCSNFYADTSNFYIKKALRKDSNSFIIQKGV